MQGMIRRRILATVVAAVSSTSVMPVLAAEIVLSDGQVLSTGRVVQVDIVAAVSGAPVAPVLAGEIVLSDGQVLSTGRVVQVDMAGRRITIEHRPIQRFYMESMTMNFRVKDPELLIALTPGDKIRFEVQRDPDGFIITKIENTN